MVRALHNSGCPLQVQHLDDATVVNFADRSIVNERAVRAISQELLGLVQKGNIRQLIINFGNVENCTSQTLSDLIACQKDLHARGGKLVLCNPSAIVREILQTTRLDRLFEIRADPILQPPGPAGRPARPADMSPGLAAPKAGPREVAVGLCDCQLERASRLLAKLLGDVSVVHFTDLEALSRFCQSQILPVVAIPLAWPARESGGGQAGDAQALSFIRAFGRQIAICVYADTELLSIDAYSRALAAGARHVINEGSPRFLEEFRQTVERLAADHLARVQEEKKLGSCMAELGMMGTSTLLREVFRRVLRASQFTDLPVLILGETGTGKQLVAEAIHKLDAKRGSKPFLTINCSTLSKTLAESELFGHSKGAFSGADSSRLGWFRAANAGVLFLDEVGELPLELQPKLLRVLQDRRLLPVGADYEHEVDVRVIVATNRPLEKMVADGSFRRDLYQRLNVFQIDIPPLRERPEDIEIQAQYFLRRCQPGPEPVVVGFGPRVMEALRLLPWEGNSRQLENLIRQAVAHKDTGTLVQMEDLPQWVLTALADRPPLAEEAGLLDALVQQVCAGGVTLTEAMAEVERRLVQKILKQAGGNRTRTASILGVTTRSIFNKIKKYQLDEPNI